MPSPPELVGGARECVCPSRPSKGILLLACHPWPRPRAQKGEIPVPLHHRTKRVSVRGVRFRPSGATATPRCPRTRGGRLRRREPRPNMRPTRRMLQLVLAFPGGLLRPVPVRRRFRRILGASGPHHQNQSMCGGRVCVCVCPSRPSKGISLLPATLGRVPAPRRARFRSHSTTTQNGVRSGATQWGTMGSRCAGTPSFGTM